ncbi:hypothetical protein pneo_cds_399 [Pandoravirus neocaledonia]|uniref:Uncharacterized protein n=1 Tax=Pandoravirus neocaledonia TaxID=2107708 RepID=A0A2U7UC40_9VIRU|nr:hypothetical protein pneo_cds_399 [Pandoravirus neocaledonia]AVK76006.1 hypothetical protein pneo_cds_399 [Pandoravirus neocaledonia]
MEQVTGTPEDGRSTLRMWRHTTEHALAEALLACLTPDGKPDAAALEKQEEAFNAQMARDMVALAIERRNGLDALDHVVEVAIIDRLDYKEIASWWVRGPDETGGEDNTVNDVDCIDAIVGAIATRARDPRARLVVTDRTLHDDDDHGTCAPWIVSCATMLPGYSHALGTSDVPRDAHGPAPIDAHYCVGALALARYLVDVSATRLKEHGHIDADTPWTCGSLPLCDPITVLLGGFIGMIEAVYDTPVIYHALGIARCEYDLVRRAVPLCMTVDDVDGDRGAA